MAQVKVNGAVEAGNGLGPTTHIVTYDDLELAAAQISEIATVAGIDSVSGHIAVQSTHEAADLTAMANVTAVVATFS
jgi:hypothetical protein